MTCLKRLLCRLRGHRWAVFAMWTATREAHWRRCGRCGRCEVDRECERPNAALFRALTSPVAEIDGGRLAAPLVAGELMPFHGGVRIRRTCDLPEDTQ